MITKKLKVIIIILLGAIISCESSFDEKQAKRLVYLSQKNIKLFTQLSKEIERDLTVIREDNSMKHSKGKKQKLINTSKSKLVKINSSRYSPIISELILDNFMCDGIGTSKNGMVIFRLKDMTDVKSFDYNDSHIHELVFNYSSEDYGYSNLENVIVDSLLSENVRYIYFTSKSGH